MAKSANRGAGPGTCEHNGVRSTMDSPWQNGSSKGSQGTMNAPFNAPRVGGGVLPTKIYDSMGGPSAGKSPSNVSSPGTIMADRKGSK